MSTGVADIEDLTDTMLQFSQKEINAFRPALLAWYSANRRMFPWRGDAGEGYASRPCTAYGIWVSEIMLQQTRTETVIPYWNRWMDKWPTVADLAAASAEEVNSMWAGLGYYRRAQQLLQGARMVVAEKSGALPSTAAELLTVPGIGPYTAGAVSSIAFGQAEPVVDGNVIRVLSRLRAVELEMGPALTKECWRLAHDLVDRDKPGDFNQAMMELGATICKPVNPECGRCPVSSACRAKFKQDADADKAVTAFPIKAEKKAPKAMAFAVHVLSRACPEGLEYLLVRRPSQGLLANQWEFLTCPLGGAASAEDRAVGGVGAALEAVGAAHAFQLSTGPEKMKVEKDSFLRIISSSVLGAPVTHLFSHQHHTMYITAHAVEGAGGGIESTLEREVRWMNENDMKTVGITTGVKKVLKMVQSHALGTDGGGAASNEKKKRKADSSAAEGAGTERGASKKRAVKSELNGTSSSSSIKSFFQVASSSSTPAGGQNSKKTTLNKTNT